MNIKKHKNDLDTTNVDFWHFGCSIVCHHMISIFKDIHTKSKLSVLLH
jgi:hypothetical protein